MTSKCVSSVYFSIEREKEKCLSLLSFWFVFSLSSFLSRDEWILFFLLLLLIEKRYPDVQIKLPKKKKKKTACSLLSSIDQMNANMSQTTFSFFFLQFYRKTNDACRVAFFLILIIYLTINTNTLLFFT